MFEARVAELEALAQQHGLDFFPTSFEVVPHGKRLDERGNDVAIGSAPRLRSGQATGRVGEEPGQGGETVKVPFRCRRTLKVRLDRIREPEPDELEFAANPLERLVFLRPPRDHERAADHSIEGHRDDDRL